MTAVVGEVDSVLGASDVLSEIEVAGQIVAAVGLSWVRMVPREAYVWFVPLGFRKEHAAAVKRCWRESIQWPSYAEVGDDRGRRFARFLGFRPYGEFWRYL